MSGSGACIAASWRRFDRTAHPIPTRRRSWRRRRRSWEAPGRIQPPSAGSRRPRGSARVQRVCRRPVAGPPRACDPSPPSRPRPRFGRRRCLTGRVVARVVRRLAARFGSDVVAVRRATTRDAGSRFSSSRDPMRSCVGADDPRRRAATVFSTSRSAVSSTRGAARYTAAARTLRYPSTRRRPGRGRRIRSPARGPGRRRGEGRARRRPSADPCAVDDSRRTAPHSWTTQSVGPRRHGHVVPRRDRGAGSSLRAAPPARALRVVGDISTPDLGSHVPCQTRPSTRGRRPARSLGALRPSPPSWRSRV